MGPRLALSRPSGIMPEYDWPDPSGQEADRVQGQAYLWAKDGPGPLAPRSRSSGKALGSIFSWLSQQGSPPPIYPLKFCRCPLCFAGKLGKYCLTPCRIKGFGFPTGLETVGNRKAFHGKGPTYSSAKECETIPVGNQRAFRGGGQAGWTEENLGTRW